MTDPGKAARVAAPKGGLRKVFGVAFGLAIIVGGTIGSGILRTPGDVAAALPNPAVFLLVWFAGGLYALGGAMTMAELAVLIPKSGGQYVFARRALGEYPGFVIGYTDWISVCASCAAGSIAIAELLGQLIPALASAQKGVAIAVSLAFVGVHWIGVKTSDKTQQILSLLKTLALIAVAVACFTAPRAAANPAEPTPVAFPSGFAFFSALILSFQSVLYTYDGWNGLVYFGGEVKDPVREVPRAMAGGVITVTLVYLILTGAFLYALGISGLAGEKFAAAAAAKAVFGATGERIVSIVMVLSLLGALSSYILQSSRVPHAMATDGLMPSRMATVNAGGSPTYSLALSAMVAIALIATGSFGTVVALAAFFYVLQYAVTFTSLFVLRAREPATPRPYKAWGYPVVPAIVLVGAIAFIVGSYMTDTVNAMRSTYILAASLPIYFIARKLVRAGAKS
ncbi:MAG: APC family permease [Gemmatimonadota bacterium]|nr:APC family permease [Gemmatimonadota bacterium]